MERDITEKQLLKRRLERLYKTFDLKYLSPDPLEFVHRYNKPGDREVVGLIAASLAYGRVAQILASIERVMELMDHDPLAFHPRLLSGARHEDFQGIQTPLQRPPGHRLSYLLSPGR